LRHARASKPTAAATSRSSGALKDAASVVLCGKTVDGAREQ
jgi:hypothetical protein